LPARLAVFGANGGSHVLLSEPFDKALIYASEIHRLQRRKGTSIPYVAHLLSVCGRVLSNGGDEAQAIAALLHDAAEDQGGEARLDDIRRRFGDAVASIVADCTDAWVEPKPEWRRRKQAYLDALPHKPAASLLVSLADKVDNAAAILRDYEATGEDVFSRFKGGKDGTLWYYRELVRIFAEIYPGPLARELSGIVMRFPD
jgi:(p)ppGpp synthase/HD superfamily hydrolase